MSALILRQGASRTTSVLTVVALMGLASGCEAGTSALRPDGSATSGAVSLADWDAITASSGVRELAISLDEQACLGRHGFQLPGLAMQLRQFPLLSRASPHTPGLYNLTETEASRWGYLLAIPPSSAPVESQYGRGVGESQRAAFVRAQFGDPRRTVKIAVGKLVVKVDKTGCLAASRARIVGSMLAYLKLTYLPQALRTRITAAWAAPAVREALSKYLSCLGSLRSQLHVRYPDDMIRSVTAARTSGATAPTPSEVELAGRDATCRTQSGMYDAYTDSFLKVAAGWLHEFQPQAEQLVAVSQQVDVKARDLIANYAYSNEPGPP